MNSTLVDGAVPFATNEKLLFGDGHQGSREQVMGRSSGGLFRGKVLTHAGGRASTPPGPLDSVTRQVILRALLARRPQGSNA